MKNQSNWKFPRVLTVSDLQQQLPQKLSCDAISTELQSIIVLDDFDWHIWRSGGLLTGNSLTGLLQLQLKNRNCLECQYNAKDRFWWELPKGELSEELKELLAVHAFVPKFQCQLTTESLSILNTDQKIVARVKIFIPKTEDKETTFVSVTSLRGYPDEFSATVGAVRELAASPMDSLDKRNLLLASGLHVDPPLGDQGYLLNPIEPAVTAVCKMAKNLLVTARRYELGIIDDIDTEFVHQYRVNIRKSRSVVSLFKKCLSAEHYQSLKSKLKALGSRTNDLRDLDVFLLDENDYRAMLPENLQSGLTPIFARIKRRRTQALNKVVALLQCDDYMGEIEQLFALLDAEPDWSIKQAQIPIKELVCKKILAQYQRICSDGKVIDDQTPDEAVHMLRIECKKLRYLLELFKELFAKKKISKMVKHLKGLQDNLGRFNDYSVQREFLIGLGNVRTSSTEQIASINGLAAVLYNKQINERGMVVENIAKFTSPDVHDDFEALFADPSREEA